MNRLALHFLWLKLNELNIVKTPQMNLKVLDIPQAIKGMKDKPLKFFL